MILPFLQVLFNASSSLDDVGHTTSRYTLRPSQVWPELLIVPGAPYENGRRKPCRSPPSLLGPYRQVDKKITNMQDARKDTERGARTSKTKLRRDKRWSRRSMTAQLRQDSLGKGPRLRRRTWEVILGFSPLLFCTFFSPIFSFSHDDRPPSPSTFKLWCGSYFCMHALGACTYSDLVSCNPSCSCLTRKSNSRRAFFWEAFCSLSFSFSFFLFSLMRSRRIFFLFVPHKPHSYVFFAGKSEKESIRNEVRGTLRHYS